MKSVHRSPQNTNQEGSLQQPAFEHQKMGFLDSRPEGTRMVQLKKMADPMQRKSNRTGLPDQLKQGIESLSGFSMDDVKVHYNSSQPAQLQAHAYAQGSQIHLGPGQEKHLPHEAWHVVQQKQGRVKPTMQLKGKVNINDDEGLEHEADRMGEMALKVNLRNNHNLIQKKPKEVVQRIPDKNQLYWDRLVQTAGPAPGGMGLFVHLENFIINPANAHTVGPNVAAGINAWILAGRPGAGGIIGLRAQVNNALNPTLANPGNYANDTAHNAILTTELQNNAFVQALMDGTFHGGINQAQGAPMAGGAIPALAPGTDDRAVEASDLFNQLTNIPGGLPAVNVNPIAGPHAAMGGGGNMDLGWAAARGTIVHELGHHLENNLGPADFATIHNFLTARTRVPPGGGGIPGGAMGGMRNAGYFFENHPGYDIEMPQINAGGLAGRREPQNLWQRIKHVATTPYHAIKQVVSRAYHATPLRYLGLIGSGLVQQGGRLASWMSGRREPRNWASKGVENFFVHNANNQQLSYSTANHNFNTPFYDGSTEYLSTTTEFFNRPSHVRELVRVDPLRVALFLHVANRPVYNLIRAAFNAHFPPPAAPVDLDDLIHKAG